MGCVSHTRVRDTWGRAREPTNANGENWRQLHLGGPALHARGRTHERGKCHRQHYALNTGNRAVGRHREGGGENSRLEQGPVQDIIN